MPLQDEQIFWLCSGETKDTLRPGRKVEARIRYVTEEDARCVLPDINSESIGLAVGGGAMGSARSGGCWAEGRSGCVG